MGESFDLIRLASLGTFPSQGKALGFHFQGIRSKHRQSMTISQPSGAGMVPIWMPVRVWCSFSITGPIPA